MNYLNQEEYRSLILECEKKAIEITKEYNILSNKNKHRICLFLEQIVWMNLVLGKR